MKCVLTIFIMAGLMLLAPLETVGQAVSIFLTRDISFGSIVPRSSNVHLKLDATVGGSPMCVPSNDCSVTGGHYGIIQLLGLGNEEVVVTFLTSSVELMSQGRKIATLISIDKFSDAKPVMENGNMVIRLGGALVLEPDLTNAAASGSLTVSVELTII